MNIIIRSYGSDSCYCRPDTTWERENKDFYSPECVNEIYCTHVVTARVSKAGKCIGEKFVSRYYDAIGQGALLYCYTDQGNRESAMAFAACADHTSRLPMPQHNPEVMDEATRKLVEDAICKASQMTSLRIGDFIAVELTSQELVASRNTGDACFKKICSDNEVLDFKILF